MAVFIFTAAGCSSTVTLGTKANDSAVIGANAGTSGASVTLPLIKAEVKATESETNKRK